MLLVTQDGLINRLLELGLPVLKTKPSEGSIGSAHNTKSGTK